MTKNEELGLRVQALEMASRQGLSHDMTLKAAETYLGFLQGREDNWMAYCSSPIKPGVAKKTAPKRAARK